MQHAGCKLVDDPSFIDRIINYYDRHNVLSFMFRRHSCLIEWVEGEGQHLMRLNDNQCILLQRNYSNELQILDIATSMLKIPEVEGTF